MTLPITSVDVENLRDCSPDWHYYYMAFLLEGLFSHIAKISKFAYSYIYYWSLIDQ